MAAAQTGESTDSALWPSNLSVKALAKSDLPSNLWTALHVSSVSSRGGSGDVSASGAGGLWREAAILPVLRINSSETGQLSYQARE